MRLFFVMALLCTMALLFPPKVYAADKMDARVLVEQMPTEGVDRVLEENDVSFGQWMEELATSSFSLGQAAKEVMVQGGVGGQITGLKEVILLALFGGLLWQMADENTLKTGGFLCTMAMTVLVMTVFYSAVHMVMDTINRLSELLTQMLPVYVTLMTMSGQAVATATMAPFVMGGAFLVTKAMIYVLLPLISFGASVTMINHLSPRKVFTSLSSLLKEIAGWGLKGLALFFMGILSFQKLTTGGATTLAGKSAKIAVEAVPVVGDILSSSVEAAKTLTDLLRGWTAAAAILAVGVVVVMPMLQVLFYCLFFKGAAALLEPVAEPKLIGALNGAGEFTALLLGALFVCCICFLFGSMLLLTVFS